MTKSQRMALAVGQAERYVELTKGLRYTEADQVERTINDLVGHFTPSGRFMLPKAVRHAMGLYKAVR